MRTLLALALLAIAGCSTTADVLVAAPPPPPLSSEKYAAIVVDSDSGRTLYQSSANAYRYPASLTKMMTLYMLFEALDSGRLSRTTEIPVSRHAASQPPSKLGLRAGSSIDAESAINALTVKSANDVAAAVGEHLGGSEDRFAAMMTAKARSLGMGNTVFRNASGLPDGAQHTSARDMAILGMKLKARFPHYFSRFAARSFAYRGRSVAGHNRLLGRVEGVDGIKTGYIRASGYNIVTSVSRRGKRLVVVVMGGKSGRERDQHVEELIERYLPSTRGSGALTPVSVTPMQPAQPPPDWGDGLPGVGTSDDAVPMAGAPAESAAAAAPAMGDGLAEGFLLPPAD